MVALTIFALAGCDSQEPSSKAVSEQMGQGGEFRGYVVMLPVSGQSFLPAEVEFLYPMVDAALRGWLQGHELRVVPADQVEAALDANGGALRQGLRSPKSQEVSAALESLANALSGQERVELIFMPQLLINSRTLQPPYKGATWDGVTRPFVLHGDRDASQPIQVNTSTLIIGIYNRVGKPEYFGRSGLDFLENGTRVGTGLVTSPKQPGQIRDTAVQQAVVVALAPWSNAVSAAAGLLK